MSCVMRVCVSVSVSVTVSVSVSVSVFFICTRIQYPSGFLLKMRLTLGLGLMTGDVWLAGVRRHKFTHIMMMVMTD